MEYATHGLYALTYGARTESGVEASEEITVRIDLRIDWQDTGTTNPDDASIRVMTDGTQGAERVEVSSTVATSVTWRYPRTCGVGHVGTA